MSPRALLFTELDGALLAPEGFASAPTREALARLADAGVVCVPVTSRTCAEVAELARELPTLGPWIVESGGGLVSVARDGRALRALGPGVDDVRALRAELERAGEVQLEALAEMPAARARELSGLAGAALERACARSFDEPCVLRAGSLERLVRGARQLGLVVRRTGQFLHLSLHRGKAAALRLLVAESAPDCAGLPRFAACASAPADFELLAAAPHAYVIPRLGARDHLALAGALPHALIAPAWAPSGFAWVVERFLAELGRATRAGA